MGVGLVPRVLVEEEIARGELHVVGDAIPSQRSYYLVYPERNATLRTTASGCGPFFFVPSPTATNR